MERDPTLATIDDITEEEQNISVPEVLPSSSGMSTSSSEYSNMAGRLLKYRSRAYRRRLSRCREEISVSSKSIEQTTATDDDDNEASDADSLASNDVFGSKDDQISFFKQTLVDMNKKLEAYQEINADLSRKLENCKVENKGLKKQIQDILWDKYVLYDKYKKLKERFGIVDSPSGDDDSPGSNNSGPSGAGRVATPVRRPKKRDDSPAGPRDGAGPSKKRTVLRCGLDREVENTSNSTEESDDSGFSMPDTSDPMLLEASVSSRKSRSRSISQDEEQYSNGKEDGANDKDHHHSSEYSTPSSTSRTHVPDYNGKDGGENEECSNVSTPCSTSGADDADNRPVCTLDADENSMEAIRMDGNANDDDDEEEEDAGSASDRLNQTGLRKRRSSDSQDEEIASDREEDEECHESSNSTSISRKRPSPSTSPSSGAGSKRTKSSSSPSDCSGSTSRASSTSSDSVRRSPSRSPSPPDFANAPRIIPPVPDGSPRYQRFWTRNGTEVFTNPVQTGALQK